MNVFENLKNSFENYKLQSFAGSPLMAVFASPLVSLGQLESSFLTDLLAEYDQLTPMQISNASTESGFLGNYISEGQFRKLNSEHKYYEISGTLRLLIWAFVRKMATTIKPKMVFDILNIRAWTTPPVAHSEFGPTDWHSDEMPISIFKIMIYLTETGDGKGGLHILVDESKRLIRKLEGPAGLFVFFSNSMIKHRGVSPMLGFPARKCIEVTVTPLPDAARGQPYPKVGGANARHPLVPFYDIIWPY